MRATLHELDRMATLCGRLRLWGSAPHNEEQLLAPLCDALGAEAAAFRQVALANAAAPIQALGSVGMPGAVTDAYLQVFHRYDPALAWLRHTALVPVLIATPVAEHQQQFQHYQREFLEPHGLHQHLGFLFKSGDGQRGWVFNFHRHRQSPRFGALEQARARLLQQVLQGQAALTPSPAVRPAILASLSGREQEIVLAMLAGLTNKKVAERFSLSVRTVENHLRGIYRKLQVHTRTQLAALLHGAE